MKNKLKKITAIVLAVLMIVSSSFVSTAVFAKENSKGENETTFRCDWFDETIIYPYEYSDSYFSGNAYDYNHELALFSLCVSMASFGSFDRTNPDENIRAMLEECGYTVESYGYNTEGYDTVGLAVGRKDIVLDGESTTVLIAAVRSGNYGMEWGGNLRLGLGENHEGFNISKNTAIYYFNEYLTDFEPAGKVKMLIPGYSRGSSIANLFAAELIDKSYTETLGAEKDNISKLELSAENLYAYLYEPPQCTSNTNTDDEIYRSIFNIVNPNDYVPMFVMDEFDFSLYGKKLYLPSASRCENYDDYYIRAVEEFDSFMAHTGKKAKNFFYASEDSFSCEVIFKNIFSYLATDVMIDRETYAKKYEGSLIFFTGQYLGKKRTVADLAKTIGTMGIACAVALIPSNYEKVKSDGFIAYVADYIENSSAGGQLTDTEVEGLIDLVLELLELIKNHRTSISTLLKQMKTVLNVHQPYVTMTWMRVLTADDMQSINSDADDELRLNCKQLTLKYNTYGQLDADFNVDGGYVKWESSNDDIVTVDEDGVIHAKHRGNATLTATLYSKDNEVIDEAFATVSVDMNAIQVLLYKVKDFLS